MVWLTWVLTWGSSPDRARTTCSPAMRAWRRLICKLGLAFQARRRASFKSRLGRRGFGGPAWEDRCAPQYGYEYEPSP